MTALWWVRRDLRLTDVPALAAAIRSGGDGVIPVFVLDAETEAMGAAARWRLGEALAAFSARQEAAGSRLILRRGQALAVLRALVGETGAKAVHWSRGYDPMSKARDAEVKAALRSDGLTAESHPGFLLHEPWRVETGQGGPYRVFTPYWRTMRGRAVDAPLPAPGAMPVPPVWPGSERLADWRLGSGMDRGGAVLAKHAVVGEAAAEARLAEFLDHGLSTYPTDRDFPDRAGTSGLSENLTWGEISPRTVWHAVWRRMEEGAPGAEAFLRQLAWREFAWHLFHHFPEMGTRNWRPEWDAFPWRADSPAAELWRRGRTGIPLVDAAMREMYVTGRMHNRARMVAASWLTKNLLTDWRVGLAWFADCLTDWDPAANALGWQWVAGSGPDSAPFFRIFNPLVQAEKFDPRGAYRGRWIAELSPDSAGSGHHGPAGDWFEAVPRSWRLSPGDPYPAPQVGVDISRKAALAAYERSRP